MSNDRKITFKSGREIWISQEIANTIKVNVSLGCVQFEIFTNESEGAFLFINMTEVESIQ